VSQISIGFEMSDALMMQAVREDCISAARESVAPRDILIVGASTAVFALAVIRESHWLWWLAGLPPVVFVLLGIGWLLGYLWLPKAAREKLAHLPNRQVRIEATDASLAFQTATERLEVAWAELKALKRRPNFWVLYLQSGTRIPVPANLFTSEAVAFFKTKLHTDLDNGVAVPAAVPMVPGTNRPGEGADSR
jgi:hypothetical protein